MDSNRGIRFGLAMVRLKVTLCFNNFVCGESSRSTEHNYFQDFEQGENVEEALMKKQTSFMNNSLIVVVLFQSESTL
ncbi:hypothetical protein H5410_051672 [Solanum commersonii]|uniref:Uncharacterized protein n=1 Tax=Solanum commersonii TaxID=4109 RepID=A0A9J5X0S0_SOLCO|nr:hypothetical protein H5410_051672 [Solanum commersonii]